MMGLCLLVNGNLDDIPRSYGRTSTPYLGPEVSPICVIGDCADLALLGEGAGDPRMVACSPALLRTFY